MPVADAETTSCGWSTAPTPVSESTPGRCWTARGMSPTSSLMTPRAAGSRWTAPPRSAKSPPGQPFWSPPTRWARLNGCSNWPSTTASSASSSASRSARFRRSNTPPRRCWSPWSPRCPSSATRHNRPRKGLPERAIHAAVAKAQVTRGAAELADSALTLHGAIGYTWEHDLHLFYKRAKLDRRAVRHTDGLERTHRRRSAAASRHRLTGAE